MNAPIIRELLCCNHDARAEDRDVWLVLDQGARRSNIYDVTNLRFDISDDKAKALEQAAERLGISLASWS